MSPLLRVLAGRDALEHVRARGLALADFDTLIAAAGGTKFLLFGGLDRVLFRALRAASRTEPLHAIGSSVGSLRLACLACEDPGAALERLAASYVALRFDAAAPGAVAGALVRGMLGDEPRAGVADPSFMRLHVLTTHCRGLAASDRPALLLAGLGLAAAGNVLSRRTLAAQLTRVVLHSRGEAGPLADLRDLPTRHDTLSAANLEAALVASAAVPFLVPGVTIPGGPAGLHRDAALLDYHPVLPLRPSRRFVLYPHFYPHLTPGWFDRSLPHRRARGPALDRTVVLAPSQAFVDRLPGRVRPSRDDARRFGYAERGRRWRAVWDASAALGPALEDLLASPARVARLAEPL